MSGYLGCYVKIFVVFSTVCVVSMKCEGPVVNTTLGPVRGVIADDGDYYMFLGIPFATVDENNPFGLALPQTQFDEIFEANDDSARCPQREEFNNTIVGDLDCLHLSIHVPTTASPTNRLPVLFWIYGGGFQFGFYGRFLYGPKYLVRNDIIVVTVNYRTGPYGFMCLDIPEVPGNQGFRDQQIALKWIIENIAEFGGDPDKITVAGNSAGSMSAEYHLQRKDEYIPLFQKAILQSGSAFEVAARRPTQDLTLQMSQHLGFETSNIYEALTFLARVDPHVIIETDLELNLSFGPCAENKFEGVETFITQNSSIMDRLPGAKDMPIMLGFTDEEGLSAAVDVIVDPLVVPVFLSTIFNATHPDFVDMAETTQRFYFGDTPDIQSYVDFLSDHIFIRRTFRCLDRLLNSDAGNVYLYKFSYNGGMNFVKHRENITVGGAAHADELGYLFDISYMDEPTPEDQAVVDAMTAMWANFIKYGDPTPQTSALLPYKWEAITKDSPQHYIDIDLPLRVGKRPLRERMTFWNLMYDGFEHIRTDQI